MILTNSEQNGKGFGVSQQNRTTPKRTRKSRRKDPYKRNKDYVANPFDVLYNSFDEEISSALHIQETVEIARNLDKNTKGDFNLIDLTSRIKLRTLGFVEIGLIAAKIRFYKLYNKKYKNFSYYCKYDLLRSRSYIDRLINASRVVITLIVNGFEVLPRNESQCRLLSRYFGSELCNRWEDFLEWIKSPDKITAQALTKFLLGLELEEDPPPSDDTWLKISKPLESVIYQYTCPMGMSVQTFLTAFLTRVFNPPEPPPDYANWHHNDESINQKNSLDFLAEEGKSILNSS